MQLWTCQAVTADILFSNMILQEKGIEFVGSLGVEDRIKSNSVPLITLSDEHLKLQEILANYNRKDIYNADETGLFFE
ncbi:tigger transposable element-derived protein 4-like [Rhizophagus irregularis DAOM 181602=DAOM 197198]|nr:tigger transposable element-derived protein 4-like [Rhizophagus irregularis DAOM 181602=DAOM 197198]